MDEPNAHRRRAPSPPPTILSFSSSPSQQNKKPPPPPPRPNRKNMLAVALLALPLVIIALMKISRRNPFPDYSGAGFADSDVLDVSTASIADPIAPAYVSSWFAGSEVFEASTVNVVEPTGPVPRNAYASQAVDAVEDKLLGGLLVTGFDEGTCLSRYQSAFYRNPFFRKPSLYLLSKLRSYEALHRRCGPQTQSYNKAVELLKFGLSPGPTDCKYLVWVSYGDLANRLLSLASAFLYALLTNRVLLVDRGENMSDLLCEPFLNVSWLLPLDFPLGLSSLDQSSSHCYGNIVKNNVSNGALPVFLYLHLVKEYDDDDKKFFCDQDQSHLQKPSWLILKTDTYSVPSLFLIPSFEQELNGMFPENEREFVFHHLGRYLFHPSNEVWGLITRYYHAYLAKADERIGIQIETFDTTTQPFSYVMDQILACSSNEKILPEVFHSESLTIQAKTQKSIAILVTSVDSGYYENLTSVYWEHPTVYGEAVSIHQASHEVFQQMEMIVTHDRKAWAEIFLLSLTDKLVTSSWSAFGYVAHSLRASWGAHWILYKPNNETASEPCRSALSMEPCFQAPPLVDCNSKYKGYSQSVVEHIRRCEDMMEGIKLVDGLSDNIS